MKKIIFIILLLFMFIPVVVNAETCDIDKISISSIDVLNTSGNAFEFDDSFAEGRKIDFVVGLASIGDSIEYKIVVKNDSNEDYELNKDSLKIQSKYVDYSVFSEDNSFIVKANSSKEIKLKITYSNPVPQNLFNNGFFENEDVLSLNLSTGNNLNESLLSNPNTGVRIFLIIFTIVLVLVIFTLVTINKKKYIKYLVLIALFIIPTSVYAICKCDITVNSHIGILKTSKFCYTYEGEEHYFDFVEGMTWGEYVNSPLNKNYIQFAQGEAQPYGLNKTYYDCYHLDKINDEYYGSYSNDIIQSSEVGCYDFKLGIICK